MCNSLSHIPSEMLSSEKCDQFASFFNNKIITIRQNISALKSTTELAFSPGTPRVSCLTLKVTYYANFCVLAWFLDVYMEC